MAEASRDENRIPTLIAVSSVDGTTPVTLYADPTTHRLLCDLSGAGTGDVSGPGAAVTDNAIARWHTTSGTDIQNSTISISDAGILAPVTTDSGVLGSITLMWSDLFLASGAVINFNNGNVTLTHAAGTLTLGGTATLALGTNSITMSGSLAATGARVTKGWFTDIESTNAPTVSGAAVYYAGGTDVAVTDGGTGLSSITALSVWVANSANTITEVTPGAGNSIRINGAGNAWEAFTPSSSVPTTITVADEATDTTCFIGFFTAATGDLGPKTNTNLTFNSSTGVLTSASLVATTADINGGTVDNATIGATTASTIVGTTITANTGLMPDADDGAYLGQSGTAFSDLFLASGAVINFSAGNVTLTHSAGVLTLGGTATLALGTNSITMTGSLAATAARVTKGWFTDIESTNMPTVGGTAILSSLTAPQFTTIELGHATDTTLARVSAGVVSIEGVNIATVSATQTLTNKTLTAPAIAAATLTGNLNFAAVPASDHTANAVTVSAFNLGATIALMDLVYLGSASKWLLADADAASTAGTVLLGITLSAGNDTDAATVVTHGLVRDDTWNWTPGAVLYVSTTAGQITATAPTGVDDVVRVVGHAVTADVIYFNPSPSHITHTG